MHLKAIKVKQVNSHGVCILELTNVTTRVMTGYYVTGSFDDSIKLMH